MRSRSCTELNHDVANNPSSRAKMTGVTYSHERLRLQVNLERIPNHRDEQRVPAVDGDDRAEATHATMLASTVSYLLPRCTIHLRHETQDQTSNFFTPDPTRMFGPEHESFL